MDTAETAGDELAEALDALARGHRILEAHGHGDATLGHMSWRAADGRGFWMKRHDIAMAEVRGPGDLLLVGWDGEVLAGEGRRHSEWLIHAEIYHARAEVNAVAHTHPFYGLLFSATGERLATIGHHGGYFRGDVPHYDGPATLIHGADQAKDLARTLGEAWAVFMKNHGVTFCGTSVPHCVVMGIALEQACREQLTLAASGVAWSGAPPDETETRTEQALYGRNIENFWRLYNRRLDRAEGRG